MLSIREIISHMSAEELERLKEEVATALQVEAELQGTRARSLEAASQLNEKLIKVSESLQEVAQTMIQLKQDIENSQRTAEKVLSEVRAKRDRDLQTCLANIPDTAFVRV